MFPVNVDGGGMTSFVVFSHMGFYPATPGMPVYNIGSPQFDSVKIDLGNGKFFEIEAQNNSAENKYIQSATLNGQDWSRPWFSHTDLISGGKLILKMGPKANRSWGSDVKMFRLRLRKLIKNNKIANYSFKSVKE